MNKLIFNNKEYELIEIKEYSFIILREGYDIGYSTGHKVGENVVYDCQSIKIKDKFYGLKLIENDKTE